MCPIVGGNWNNGAIAGVWALNLNNVRGNSNDNVGCRADSVTPRMLQGNGGTKGEAFRRAVRAVHTVRTTAKSECRRLSGSVSRAGAPVRCERQASVVGPRVA
jgi:hypothetical protein